MWQGVVTYEVYCSYSRKGYLEYTYQNSIAAVFEQKVFNAADPPQSVEKYKKIKPSSEFSQNLLSTFYLLNKHLRPSIPKRKYT